MDSAVQLDRPHIFREDKASYFRDLRLSPQIRSEGYLGAIIRFDDDSCWKLTKASSDTKYQQGEPPFVARCVYEATCVEDPKGTHVETETAVVKIKYQVQATPEGAFFFEQHANTRPSILMRQYADPNEYTRKLDDANKAERLLHQATHSAEVPHRYTIHEVRALRYFGKHKCTRAPHLLGLAVTDVVPCVDEQGMVGGYALYMLMTKIPGRRVDHEMFWGKSEAERETIRRSFKEALLDLWKLKINPQDWAMRNLMWDEKEHKCYIVDFEDYEYVDFDLNPDTFWGDCMYRAYGISEECKPTR